MNYRKLISGTYVFSKQFCIAVGLSSLVLGCAATPPLGYGPEPSTSAYTAAEESGLLAVRPYPTTDDVCQVIGENDVTQDLLDDSALLIGCPKHESVAIADRIEGGATVVAHARHWTLLSVPN